jgi:L-iditol 2-dehydrogenase
LKDKVFENYEVKSFPVPEPGDDAVVAKVEMCGICGTDVHITRGRLAMPFPTMLGHEWYGKVVALGKNVKADYLGKPLKEGDPITTAVGSCGKCWFCKNTPRKNLCEHMAMIGIWPEPTDKRPYFYGAYSECVYVEPNIPVFKFDPGYTPEEMTMAEPMDVAARVWKRALSASTCASFVGEGVDVSRSVVILGSGPIGMSILVTALVYGMSNIIVIDPIQERLDKAKRLGAAHIINPKEVDSMEKREELVKDLTSGVGADVVIEATGEPPAFVEAFKLVRRGGTFVEMGHFTDTGDAVVNPHRDFCNKDIQVFGTWAHTSYDMRTALAVMAKAKALGIPFGDIVAEKGSLDEVPRMVERHEARVAPGKIALKV